jgi:Domain of unknown function (DUF6378)
MPRHEDPTLWDDADLPSEKATEINRARERTYGHPAYNMRVFAKLISPVVFPDLDREVTPEQAAMILVQLKVMREVQGDYPVGYPDNLEDICGFVNVLYKTKEAGKDATAESAPTGERRVGGEELPRQPDASKPTRRSRGAG